jgi:Family of unknown function (DUF6069)
MSVQTVASQPRTLAGRAGIVVLAVVSAVIVWLVVTKLANVNLVVKPSSRSAAVHVGLASVVVVSLVAGLLGWGSAALVERFSARPARTWTIVGVVALVISLAGPLTAAQSTAAKISLACIHLVVGAVLIPSFARSATG